MRYPSLPMNIRKKLDRALEALRSGQLDTAGKLYQQIILAAPSNAEAHRCLGSVLLSQGRKDEALASMRRAIKLNPRHAPSHNSLGVVLLMCGDLDDAQKSFERALELQPSNAEAACNLGDLFTTRGMFKEALESFERSLKLDPKNPRAANNLGNAFVKIGLTEQATKCYRQALAIDPNYKVASDNLAALSVRQVPQWHFDMLADDARNEVFQKAIERAVTEDSLVLDIGTGSGLLSMVAARAGAAEVVTCEMSEPIAWAAKEIIANNGYSDRIKVIAKPSTQLVVGVDMAKRATLLVSEILDNKLLGEDALPSLRHAVDHLVEPGAPTIPRAARIKAMLVEAPTRRKTNPLREVCGFDVSQFEQFRDKRRFLTVMLEHEDLRPLSGVITALELDFADLPPATQETDPNRHVLEVEARASGRVQGVAFWFELDVDEEASVSSGAGGELKHWQQNLHLFPHDVPVNTGDTLRLEVTQSDQTIRFIAPEKLT